MLIEQSATVGDNHPVSHSEVYEHHLRLRDSDVVKRCVRVYISKPEHCKLLLDYHLPISSPYLLLWYEDSLATLAIGICIRRHHPLAVAHQYLVKQGAVATQLEIEERLKQIESQPGYLHTFCSTCRKRGDPCSISQHPRKQRA